MQVLAGLGALEAGRSGWRVEGRGCPFGSVHIDPQGCSCCGACVSVCPRGALTVDTDDSGSLCLNLDPARCSACGACVVTCPEKVISLERSVDGAVVAAGTTVVVVATQPAAACDLCGSPLGVRLSPEALLRAGGSHRFLAAGAESLCADCRLSGRSAVSAR
jgi:ferredoxin